MILQKTVWVTRISLPLQWVKTISPWPDSISSSVCRSTVIVASYRMRTLVFLCRALSCFFLILTYWLLSNAVPLILHQRQCSMSWVMFRISINILENIIDTLSYIWHIHVTTVTFYTSVFLVTTRSRTVIVTAVIWYMAALKKRFLLLTTSVSSIPKRQPTIVVVGGVEVVVGVAAVVSVWQGQSSFVVVDREVVVVVVVVVSCSSLQDLQWHEVVVGAGAGGVSSSDSGEQPPHPQLPPPKGTQSPLLRCFLLKPVVGGFCCLELSLYCFPH